MGDADEPSLRSSVKSKTFAVIPGLGRKKNTQPVLPTHNEEASNTIGFDDGPPTRTIRDGSGSSTLTKKPTGADNAHSTGGVNKSADPSAPVNDTAYEGETASAIGSVKRPLTARVKDGSLRFLSHTKNALTHSWINLLLVFVPVGIAAKLVHLKPVIVFSMNAIAIIPLAGLLAHATEVVAARVGDALGALLNVSFGNAVELILFIILLAQGQIEVVQASLLGSILANLLLILGMAFLLGGLKYQEQVSTIHLSTCDVKADISRSHRASIHTKDMLK
jgi:Ca2+:H+ antiporter